VKGLVYLEELPSHQVVLQMVGKRYHIGDTEPWGSLTPRSEIVMIASYDGIDSDALQGAFDGCIGDGDESQSPMLRLTRLLAADKVGGS
jgi:Cobalamin synthesis protein cobW C-terminal domain